jgi:hypothetical protein
MRLAPRVPCRNEFATVDAAAICVNPRCLWLRSVTLARVDAGCSGSARAELQKLVNWVAVPNESVQLQVQLKRSAVLLIRHRMLGACGWYLC